MTPAAQPRAAQATTPRPQPRRVRLLALLALCALLAPGASAGMEALAATGQPAAPAAKAALEGPAGIELAAVSAPMALASAYGLGVVELPEPPPRQPSPRGEAAAQPPPAGCPVEVRGIVLGDSSETTFALLAAGDRSELLSAGEGARMAGGWLAVSRIRSDHVLIRYGRQAFHCPLRGEAPARPDPER